jgi:hypothetical protein
MLCARIRKTTAHGWRPRIASHARDRHCHDVEAKRIRHCAKCAAIRLVEATEALLVLGSTVLDDYAARKAARAGLDYDDLVAQALKLLEDTGAAWVHYKLDGGIDHVLVDEAQDTSPDQWRIVRALTLEFFAGKGAERDGGPHYVCGRDANSRSSRSVAPIPTSSRRCGAGRRPIRETGEVLRAVPLDVCSARLIRMKRRSPITIRCGMVEDGSDPSAAATCAQEYVELWPLVLPRDRRARCPGAAGRAVRDLPRERMARDGGHIASLIRSGERLICATDRFRRAISRAGADRNEPSRLYGVEGTQHRVAGIDHEPVEPDRGQRSGGAGSPPHAEDDLALATALRGPLAISRRRPVELAPATDRSQASRAATRA